MADDISTLPTDQNAKNTPQELRILSQYFETPGRGRGLFREIKDVVIAAIIFLVLANPLTDWGLNYVPHMGSPLTRTVAKVLMFAIAFYVVLLMVKK